MDEEQKTQLENLRAQFKGPDKSALLASQKKDQDKIPLQLLPFDALTEIARVLQFGAKKYAARGWEKGIEYDRVFGATMRHLWAWHQGEDNDPETGLSHLAHAGCEILFLLAFTKRGRVDLDDRPCRTQK